MSEWHCDPFQPQCADSQNNELLYAVIIVDTGYIKFLAFSSEWFINALLIYQIKEKKLKTKEIRPEDQSSL